MNNKPFSADYVIRETLRHMQDSINISTQKTLARIKEFEGDPVKTSEVMDVLSSLSILTKLIEDIRENNKSLLNK